MAGDIIHQGHINIIKAATKHGELIVGLLSDTVIGNNKRIPIMNFGQRKEIIENIKGVSQVIEQNSIEYTDNLEKLKPEFVIHGDDWKVGKQAYIRQQVIEQLKQWNGELIEIPYTDGISSSSIEELLQERGVSAGERRKRLQLLLSTKNIVRVLEAHNGLTGLIVEKTVLQEHDERKEFDAMWISSLCDSTAKGKPDIELVDYTSRINTINEIIEVTTKPIILDGDTGGLVEHFVYNVRTLERLGVSAIIIEDKVGLKKNSLFGTEAAQQQATPEEFAHKIRAGKQAQLGNSFMIIARIESLILKQGIDDALHRAKVYIEAGTDGIMIHSKEKDGSEIKEFLQRYKQEVPRTVPVVVVPTTYNHITEQEFYAMGANIVIYANHLIRSAYLAMKETAETILRNERSAEVDKQCLPIKEILTLIPQIVD